MKFKLSYITNSSSTAFFITNTSNKAKTLVDFVLENPQLIEQFVEQYDYNNDPKYTQIMLVKSAKINNIEFKPGQTLNCIFGDEDRTLIGGVFDYILRDGGKSKSFTWRFDRFLR